MFRIDFKNKDRKIIWVILILLFLLSLGTFIASSWYLIDLKMARYLEKTLGEEITKYWSQYYNASGNTELLSILFILLMVIFESFFIYMKKFKPATITGRRYNLIYIFYAAIFVGWIVINVSLLTYIINADTGFGKGVDGEIMDSIKYKLVGRIIGMIIQTSFIGIGFYVVHFKLKFRQDFLIQRHWVRAFKALVFFAFSYLVVIILKTIFERQYLYNLEFANLLVKKFETDPEMVKSYLTQTGTNYGGKVGNDEQAVYDYLTQTFGSEISNAIRKYMDLDGSKITNFFIGNIDGEWPWYISNGIWSPTPITAHNEVPYNTAFPSGHTGAAFCTASILFLFMDIEIKDKRVRIAKWTMLTLGIVNIINMMFAVVVMRWHWMSDVTFTMMLCIVSIPLSHLIVNRILNRIIKINNKKKDQCEINR